MAIVRLYVIHADGKPVAIVRAASRAQAIAHHIADKYEAIPADAEHMVALKHLPVETAGKSDPSDELPGTS